MKKLFTNYNLKVRPAANPMDRVVVRVGMILTSFVGLVRDTNRPLFVKTQTKHDCACTEIYRQTKGFGG